MTCPNCGLYILDSQSTHCPRCRALFQSDDSKVGDKGFVADSQVVQV
jgi:hypothetical protein